MRSVKSFYSRTSSGPDIKVLAFEGQEGYLEFVKNGKYSLIHDVDEEDGLIIVKYTE